jgi:hypothetical protein
VLLNDGSTLPGVIDITAGETHSTVSLGIGLAGAQHPVKVPAANLPEFKYAFFPEHLLVTQMRRILSVDAEPYEFEFEPAHCALLIIDMQRDFLEPGGCGEMLGCCSVAPHDRSESKAPFCLAICWFSGNTHSRGASTGSGRSATGKKDPRAQ